MQRGLARPLAALAKRATNNQPGQALLGGIVSAAQYLQGVGAGSDVRSSGEMAIFEKLKASRAPDRRLCVFDAGANQGQFFQLARHCLSRFSVHDSLFRAGARGLRTAAGGGEYRG